MIPHLIDSFIKNGEEIESAVYKSLSVLKGAFAMVLLCKKDPNKIIVAKNSSPLILGIGEGENFIASDIPALLSHTRDIVVLEDGQVAIVTKDQYSVTDFGKNPIEKKPRRITWSRTVAEKEGTNISCSRKSMSSLAQLPIRYEEGLMKIMKKFF